MSRRFLRPFVSLSVALCLVGLSQVSATAWGGQGHRIVARIAWLRLAELEAQGDVKARNALRRAGRLLSDQLGETMADRPSTIEAAATWPDVVVKRSDYLYAKKLHYVSIPRDLDLMDASTPCSTTDNARVPEGDCIIGGLVHFEKILRDVSDSKKHRLEALSFIVHFIGDMHQPLHTSEDTKFPNHLGELGDRGGNNRFVCYYSESMCGGGTPAQNCPPGGNCSQADICNPDGCNDTRCYRDLQPNRRYLVCSDVYEDRVNRNLHATWDKHMLITQLDIEGLDDMQYAQKLKDAVNDSLVNSALTPQQLSRIERGDLVKWAEEAHALAKNHVYIETATCKRSAADRVCRPFYYVTRDYQASNIKVIDSQLKKGGLRLAEYLRQILG